MTAQVALWKFITLGFYILQRKTTSCKCLCICICVCICICICIVWHHWVWHKSKGYHTNARVTEAAALTTITKLWHSRISEEGIDPDWRTKSFAGQKSLEDNLIIRQVYPYHLLIVSGKEFLCCEILKS